VNTSLRVREISRRLAGVVCVARLLLVHAFVQGESAGKTAPNATPADASGTANVATGANSVAPPPKTKVNPKDGLTYVWIPPGKFQMGCSPDDKYCTSFELPVHSVTLTAGFWMGQMPVTQKDYMKVEGSNPSGYPGDQIPVVNVTWFDVQAYCKAMEMRLPTEAEWEYAARGGSPSQRYGPLANIAWNSPNGDGATQPVGQKQPNAYGLYDMLGNVQQWASDWIGAYTSAPVVDPQGPPSDPNPNGSYRYRVVRGSQPLLPDDDGRDITASYRYAYSPYSGTWSIGFRCVGD
jgi:formylglycine-generating enzyme required for sulfatase activity